VSRLNTTTCKQIICTLVVFDYIENKEIQQVRSFKYLGSTVNTDNTIEEEIKERIALGNKAFFANKKIFQSKLISKRQN